MLANATEVSGDFVIRNANHAKTIFFQKSGAVCIVLQFIHLIVLRAVQFNDKLCFCTIKISDIFSENFLSGEADRIGT